MNNTLKNFTRLTRELYAQIKGRDRLRASAEMTFFNKKLVGQGHMIEAYSSLDQELFMQTIKNEFEYIKKIKAKEEITVVDAGANLGFYSIAYSMIDGVRVVAFEPFPETFNQLRQNIEHNKIENVVAKDVGLFSEDANMPIGSPLAVSFYGFFTKLFKFTDKVQTGCNSVFTVDKNAPRAKFVKGDTYEYLSQVPHVDFIKIDVEGAELNVIQGLRNTIKSHRPVLNIEFNMYALSAAGLVPRNVWDALMELGYQQYTICSSENYLENWRSMEEMPAIEGSKDFLFSY